VTKKAYARSVFLRMVGEGVLAQCQRQAAREDPPKRVPKARADKSRSPSAKEQTRQLRRARRLKWESEQGE